MDKQYFHHALKISEKECTGCTHCVKVCPTEAIRLKAGKAYLYENRCVDCGECFRVCPVNAIFVDHDDFNEIFNYKYRVLLVPSVMLGQFPESISTSQIFNTLYELGFTHVFEIEKTVDILIEARNKFKTDKQNVKPLISTFCPAVVRLIQVKFPSLVEHLILQKSPIDIAAMYYKKLLLDQGANSNEIGLFYITPCAAKIAAVKSPVGEDTSLISGVINMNFIYNKVYKAIKQNDKGRSYEPLKETLSAEGLLWSLTDGEKETSWGRALAIDEIHNVIEFLEKIENDEIKDVDFIELRACDESCAGGILTNRNRFLTVETLKNRAKSILNGTSKDESKPNEVDVYKDYLIDNIGIKEVKPRSMLKLDEDMSEAINKLGGIHEIMTFLPMTDCSLCGAPTCQTLAEDIVFKRAELTDCIFIQRKLEQNGSMSMKEAIEKMEHIWGYNKIDTK